MAEGGGERAEGGGERARRGGERAEGGGERERNSPPLVYQDALQAFLLATRVQ